MIIAAARDGEKRQQTPQVADLLLRARAFGLRPQSQQQGCGADPDAQEDDDPDPGHRHGCHADRLGSARRLGGQIRLHQQSAAGEGEEQQDRAAHDHRDRQGEARGEQRHQAGEGDCDHAPGLCQCPLAPPGHEIPQARTQRAGERLTVNAGLRYEEHTLIGTIQQLTTLQGNTIDNFALAGNWAPRLGVVYDVIGNGKSKLYGNYGRFFARIPNDLAARALSADDGVSRIDYFDASLTRPIPNGVLAGGQTNHYVAAGVGADQIDEDAKLSFKDEFVAGFEYEAWPNINIGARYIRRWIGRVLEDVAQYPVVAYDLGLPGTGSVEYILTNPDARFPALGGLGAGGTLDLLIIRQQQESGQHEWQDRA